MKKFFKDYWELMKQSGNFCKDHWLGMIIFTVALTGTELLIMNPSGAKELLIDTKDKIKSKFQKEGA